jgi:hypothetical protein
MFFVWLIQLTCKRRRLKGLPGSWHFSHCMPSSMTPAVPPESCLDNSFILASDTLKSSPTALYSDEAELLKGGTSPRRPTVFPVYVSRLLFSVIGSVSRATLGTGYWLGLARQGLCCIARHPARSTKLRLAH